MLTYFESNTLGLFVSLFISIGLIFQLFSFFKSIRVTFYVFLAVAFIQLLALGKFWFDHYNSYSHLDRFVQPILSQFDGPETITDGLSLQDIKWDGAHLTHIYRVTSREKIPSSRVVQISSCSGQVRISVLALGGVLEHIYMLDGIKVAGFQISLLSCFTDA